MELPSSGIRKAEGAAGCGGRSDVQSQFAIFITYPSRDVEEVFGIDESGIERIWAGGVNLGVFSI